MQRLPRHLILLLSIALPACDSGRNGTPGLGDPNGWSSNDDFAVPATTDDGGTPNGTGMPCAGLQCQQHSCGEMVTTTIKGTVYDPAGNNPLYNVVVFVPNSTPKPFSKGASCESCSSLYTGDPVVVALTDAKGQFTLTNAPDGPNIPLVVQIGKWRRQFTIPNVKPCQDNQIPDKHLTLPANQKQGDIPNIAISTGGADTLECLLRRIGVDASEYTGSPNGGGRIHIFAGGDGGLGNLFPGLSSVPNTNPPGPSSSTALWSSQKDLMVYDIVLLSCEGMETMSMNQDALHAYASGGGRVFASHFHYAWFNSGPYGNENLASWAPGGGQMGDINAKIVQTFPKGKALHEWLGNVGALDMNDELPIKQARHNADVSAANKWSQAWITADQNANPANATEYFSFNTPTNAKLDDAGVPNYCGRVVFSDLHVGAASMDYQGGGGLNLTTPDGCSGGGLSAQEKALEFMLFDLSSCVQPDGLPPAPPIS
jgi:hypothetical protein